MTLESTTFSEKRIHHQIDFVLLFSLNKNNALLTVPGHADIETFLEPAKLASVPIEPDHEALLIPQTSVLDFLLNTAPEKALLKKNLEA